MCFYGRARGNGSLLLNVIQFLHKCGTSFGKITVFLQKWDDINSKKPKNLGKETPGKSPSSCQKPPKALLCSPLQWKKKISHYDSFHFCHRVPQADQRTELLVVYTFTYLTKSPGGHRQAGSPSLDQNAHRTIFSL